MQASPQVNFDPSNPCAGQHDGGKRGRSAGFPDDVQSDDIAESFTLSQVTTEERQPAAIAKKFLKVRQDDSGNYYGIVGLVQGLCYVFHIFVIPFQV